MRIDVVEVPRARLMEFAGRPWGEVVTEAERGDGVRLTFTEHNNKMFFQSDSPQWTPPLDRANNELPWLSRERAWLREIDHRAFLYAQNW